MFQQTEHTIGRGEVSEGRLEAPFFAAFMLLCAIAILIVHLYWANYAITIALTISVIVFGTTVIRVDYGLYILVTAMLLSPEINMGPMGPGQQQSLNIRYDDLLIIVIFLGVLVRNAFEGRQTLWRPNPINKPIAVFLAICIVSTVRALMLAIPSWDKKMALFVFLKMLEFYMIFVLVGNAVRTIPEIRRQLRMFLIVGLIVAVYCSLQIGSGNRLSPPFEQGGTEPNTLGGYLIIIMCMTLAMTVHAQTWPKRLLYFAMAITAFIPFFFSLSRASYIAFLAVLFAFGIMGRRIFFLLLLLLICALFPLMPTEVRDRVNATFQRGSGEEIVIGSYHTGVQVDKSTHERIYVWEKVWFNIQHHPLLGLGIAWGMVLDSQYARVIMETGLLGLAAFLWIQWRTLRVSRNVYKWSADRLGKAIGLGTFAMTIGLIVHSLGTITFLIVRIMEPYWFLIAIAVVARDIAIANQN